MLKPFIRALIVFLSLFSLSFPQKLGLARKVSDKEIDMSKFDLVWSDEFDADSLDSEKWGYSWWITERKGGYWHEDMVSVRDGNLVISAEYKSEPLENRYYDEFHETVDFKPYKKGWYSGKVTTLGKYEQKYGYMEARCILPASSGMWSAFWLMNDGVFNIDSSGKDGTEIDVFESMSYDTHRFGLDKVSVNLHFDGYEKDHRSEHVGNFFIENNPYKEYNTYGVEWNENEYIFYINGKEAARTSFGGVSQNPEYLLLSLEIAGNDGVSSEDPKGKGRMKFSESGPVEFKVDYVRCYQYKDLIG